jgi:hypothetical protein
MKTIQKYKSRLASRNRTQSITAAITIIAVAVVSAHVLLSSHAQSPYAATYAADGQLNGVKLISGGSNSNGQAVQFESPPNNTPLYPSQILNLSDWKITMPYDANGEQFEPGVTPGDAEEVTQPALATFSDSKYFYVNSTKDGVVFMAPVNGATTSGSGYPRTELRQMASSSGTDEASWSMDSSAINSETVEESVQHLPEVKPQIVVGQIHDADHDIIEILADATGTHSSDYTSSEPSDCSGSGGDINNTGCQFDICYRYDGTEQPECLVNDYTIGDKYSLTISVQSNVITLSATYNGTTVTLTQTDTQSADGTDNYFKAGCYTQSNVTTEGNYTDYGEDEIYDISTVYSP